jgi:2'-5' RNA ligase
LPGLTEEALRTALVVAVPGASAAVDRWRERTLDAKPSAGVPPHVTILSPFAAPDDVTEPLVEDLRALLLGFPSFDLVLDTAARFAAMLWLEPTPSEPFARMTRAVWDAYPDYPPYGGEFDTIVPHLTVAAGDPRTLDEAEADVRRSLPITGRVREIVLLEADEPSSASWVARATFPLADT